MEIYRAKTYKTKDIGEASALLSKNIKLLRLEPESDFYWFIFEGNNAEEISSSYWSGELTVSAKEFYDRMRSLKDRLFAQK